MSCYSFFVTSEQDDESFNMMWLCSGAVVVRVDGIPNTTAIITSESLLGQHCFVHKQRKGVLVCQYACEYLDIQAEGLEKEVKRLQSLQEQQQQQTTPTAGNTRPPLFSSNVCRVKKLLRNGVAVAAFKQNPLTQDKRVLDGADPVWVANVASLSSDGVLALEDVDDSSDAVTVSVSQALVMTGSSSHPLLSRRASFCLAVSSSIAHFISCSDESLRSEWLQALAAAGAVIENPDMLTAVSHKDTLVEAALQQTEIQVPTFRDSGKTKSSNFNMATDSSGSAHHNAASDSIIPPAPPLSRKKSADPPLAPKSPSVNTPTPAPVLAPAQIPPLLPQRSSPLSDSLPPPSPILSHSSSYETFALQVSFCRVVLPSVHTLALKATPFPLNCPIPSSPHTIFSCASPLIFTPMSLCPLLRMTSCIGHVFSTVSAYLLVAISYAAMPLS